ncbi:hypothetical protein BH11ARM2_BH11ARM2_11310 [soil metagenome]
MLLLGKWSGFDAQEVFEEGVAALERGDEEAAIDAFEAILNGDAEVKLRESAKVRLGRARLALARRMLRTGHYERACRLLDEAGMAMRGMPELHALAARTHLALGDRRKASQHLKEGAESDPDHTPIVALQAAMALEGRDTDGFHSACDRLGEFGKRVANRSAHNPGDALRLLLEMAE